VTAVGSVTRADHILRAVRILTVGNMYPPHHYGGYELVWQSAVEHLRARGHEVRVLTTDTRTGARDPDGPGVHRELRWHLRNGEFEPAGRLASRATARHNHRVLDRHLDELRPDAVAWWSMGGLSLTMLETVRRRGIPAAAFVHDEWLEYGRWADPWLRSLSRRGGGRVAPLTERIAGVPAVVDYGRAANYHFVSEFTRRHAHALGLALDRTGVAHSGIHPDFLDPAPEREWAWRLLYVGRVDPRKGVETAVGCLRHLPPEAHLTIAGGWEGEEEGRLRDLAAATGLQGRVTFAGQRTREELMADYAAADAVVFPVVWNEPWGLVPLEAMARGRPVIATGRGGSAEYLRDGENCLLFEAGDAEALAAAVGRLAADPGLRAHLRTTGERTAEQHTEPVFNEAVERALLAAPEGGERRLDILHLGTGFRPWRRGGLVAYVEDLAYEQGEREHRVTYLFSGRHYRFLRGPRLKRWQRGRVAMLEVVNSPLHHHGRQPEKELDEPRLEAMLRGVIGELRPDVLHVQELAGWPSSVIEVAQRAGVPVIATLQDYFPLCPTFRLLDSQGKVCLRAEIGEDCVATTAAHPVDESLLFEATLRHDLHTPWLLDRLGPERLDRWAARVARVLTRGAGRDGAAAAASPAAFQRRRDANVERLGGADALVAMSDRVAEIYSGLGVAPGRMHTSRLTLKHIEYMRPRTYEERRPVTFATLGGGESVAKGSRLLLGALANLDEEARAGRFRLLVFGFPDAEFAAAASGMPGVELRGLYPMHALDELLDEVDVGIMPSIWEEAYGYAGIEFLAKGIPVIGNAIGGIPEYVREGETGWLNASCSADGLASIIRQVTDRPEQIAELNARLRATRASVIVSMIDHAQEMESLYREKMAAGGGGPARASA
jgi:glycosyltransferase involved in cell wall biosynthesis